MGKAPSPKLGILKKAKLSLEKDKKKNLKFLGKDMLLGKSTKPLAKGKAKAKAKAKAQQLTKKSLEKLGSMTLKEKIQTAAEQASDPEEAAAILKQSLSAAENGKVWSKHQTFLKHNPLEKGQFEALDKKSKGMAAALWLVQHDPSARGYLHTSQSVNCGGLWKKTTLGKVKPKCCRSGPGKSSRLTLAVVESSGKRMSTPQGCMFTKTPSLGKD